MCEDCFYAFDETARCLSSAMGGIHLDTAENTGEKTVHDAGHLFARITIPLIDSSEFGKSNY